jgi:hypothetical protein
MTDAGYVSVPRRILAATLNRSPRRITERLELARDAGYIAIVRQARPGRTAEYVATLPDSSEGAPVRTSNGVRPSAPLGVRITDTIPRRPSAPPKPDGRGADGGPPNARASSSATKNKERTDENVCELCGQTSSFTLIGGLCRKCRFAGVA